MLNLDVSRDPKHPRPLNEPNGKEMLDSIGVRHDAEGVPDRSVKVDLVHFIEPAYVPNNIPEICSFDNEVLPYAGLYLLSLVDVTDDPGELCHIDQVSLDDQAPV